MLCVAEGRDEKAGGKVAAALFFFRQQQLSMVATGGARKNMSFCTLSSVTHQGIEFAIEKNLFCFDAGAQGEHKISRGFKPVEVRSSHWIRHPGFAEAIQAVLDQEDRHTKDHIVCAADNLAL